MCPIPDGLGLYCEPAGPVPCHVTQYLGHPFVYPVGSEVGAAVARGWEWDRVLRDIVQILLPEEDPTVCEVGSNIGASVLEILHVKPRARVSCYEPSNRFRAFLIYNLQLAGFGKVAVRPYLVDRNSGEGFIHHDHTSGSIRTMDHLGIRQEARVVTLDEEFRGREAPLAFLKTDTDGNDLEVLQGGEALLREDHPVVFMEFCPGLMQTDAREGLVWLQAMGYGRFVCLDHLGFLVGVTSDAAKAVEWSVKHSYCDVLTCAAGSEADDLLARLALTPSPRKT